MAEEDIQRIKVIIAGRSIPIRVPSTDVDRIQSIVAEVNRKVLALQNAYSAQDIRDCLSMALLSYAVDLDRHSSSRDSDGESSGLDLNRIDQLLDQYIR